MPHPARREIPKLHSEKSELLAAGLGSLRTILTFGRLTRAMQVESWRAGVRWRRISQCAAKLGRPGSDSGGGGDGLRRRRSGAGGKTIDAALAGEELEFVGDAEHRLGAAEEEEAVLRHQAGDAVQDLALGRLVEIDQHVADEDHVEPAERARVVQQIELAVLHHGADLLVD